MDETATAKSSKRELDEALARVREQIPFPKMVIIHQGWFRDRISRRSVEELEREDRERAARG